MTHSCHCLAGYKGLYFYNKVRLQNAMSLHGDNIIDPDFTHEAQTHTVANPTWSKRKLRLDETNSQLHITLDTT